MSDAISSVDTSLQIWARIALAWLESSGNVLCASLQDSFPSQRMFSCRYPAGITLELLEYALIPTKYSLPAHLAIRAMSAPLYSSNISALTASLPAVPPSSLADIEHQPPIRRLDLHPMNVAAKSETMHLQKDLVIVPINSSLGTRNAKRKNTVLAPSLRGNA
jgi:hypothetical protein